MLNYKFWLFVMWMVIGTVNLTGKEISKLSYTATWIVVVAWTLTNWLQSVGVL